MSKMKISTRIDAPVETVFAACTDFAGMADRIGGIKKIEMLGDGSVGVGTRFRETRVMFKKEAVEEMEVSEFVKNSHYTLTCNSCGCSYAFRHDFRPDDGGTIIDMTMDGRAVTFFAKLMTPVSMLMAGTMRKCIEKDMADLRASIEGSTAGASA